jgi:hypothetical protein
MCVASVIKAQDSELWGDVNIYKNINSKFSVFGDAGPRWNTNNEYYGFYIRPSAAFKISNHVTIGGGVAWFYANSNDASVNEFRVWQGTRVEWKIAKRLILSNYIRFEERWFFDPDYLQFLLRFRWLAGLIIPINNKTLEAKTLYLPLAFEVFEDLNSNQGNFINRTRVYGGVGYVLNANTRLELFYIANSSRSDQDDSFNLVNVLRVRFHFTIPERPVLID